MNGRRLFHLLNGPLLVLLLSVSGLVGAAPRQGPSLPTALPEPRPKLTLSTKEATPMVVESGGVMTYTLLLRNTGAEAAPDALLYDPFPANTTYNGDAWASAGTIIEGPAGITWTGKVPFDGSVVITFSVTTAATYTGQVINSAFLTQSAIPEALTLTAVGTVTDRPILGITKEGDPLIPGAGKPLTYTLWVRNAGWPATGLLLTVTDRLPSHTALLSLPPEAISDTLGHITWTRLVTLGLGERTPFTFSVLVESGLPSGTVLLNEGYAVTSTVGVGARGAPYTQTVLTPIFLLTKETEPDPPGSNRALVYTLTLRNDGSPATAIVVTDTVPTNVTYITGGTYLSATNTVSWTWPQLATGEKAALTYSVMVGNLPGGTPISNDRYGVTCAEGVWAAGVPLTSTIQGPILDTSFKQVDPIAMKPGGGDSTLTYTIGIRNTGQGNALDVYMRDAFTQVSFTPDQITVNPPVGVITYTRIGNLRIVEWQGDLPHHSQVTITVGPASNVFGGVEVVTNTAVISDDLTGALSVTTHILVTHDARLNVYKSGPAVVGPNEVLTYTFRVRNSAFTTDPPVWLTDTLPAEVTFLRAGDGGGLISGTGVVSWTLPPLGPGVELTRTLTVLVGDWPSGTLIVDEDFLAGCPNCAMTDTVFTPVTTTVLLRDLGESYKRVTPRVSLPGPAVVLTYTVHIVNPTGIPANGVILYDYLPWPQSTYNRDAVASAGSIISDIVHLEWTGDVDAHSREAITLSVLVDSWYRGAVTNTAVISHPSLSAPVTVTAVAWVTDEPVLRLTKRATPDPVGLGEELLYTLRLRNLGQRATGLVISDTIPANTTYVPGSATKGGVLVGDTVRWEWPEIEAGRSEEFAFRVTVAGGSLIRNETYLAGCVEGIWAYGDPVETRVRGGLIYLPLVFKGY